MPVHHRRLRIVFLVPHDGQGHQRQEVVCEGLAAAGHEIGARAPLGELLRRARRVQQPDVVVGSAGLDVLLARLRWPRSRIVVDVHEAHLESRRCRAVVRRADLVMVSTLRQSDLLSYVDRQKVVVGPVGAPTRWFAAAEQQRAHASCRPDQGGGPMRVIALGGSTPLADAATVGAVVRRLADDYVEWTLVGARGDEQAVRAELDGRGKVTWIDHLAVDDLSQLVADHDVCLGTFGSAGTGRHAEVAVPADLVHAAAAGCAIVATATSSQREAFGDAAVFVPPGDPDAVASVVAALAAEPGELARRREALTALAARSFLPARVTEELVDRLAEGPAVPF